MVKYWYQSWFLLAYEGKETTRRPRRVWKIQKNRQINIGDLGIVSVNEWNIGRYLPISGSQTDENRENIGSNIGRISAWQNGSNPNLGFFPGSSFSTREASNFSIFRWIFQRWHLWSLPKLPELVWNSKRIIPIYSETFRLHHVCFTLNIKNYFKVCTSLLKIGVHWGPSLITTIMNLVTVPHHAITVNGTNPRLGTTHLTGWAIEGSFVLLAYNTFPPHRAHS